MAFSNPFSRDVEGTRRNIAAYKVLTLLSFILQFATAVCYMHHAFVNSKSGRHVNPFSLSHVFVSIYWVVLWILQVVYIWHLFRRDETAVNSAAAVGSYFILYNVLQFAWVLLWGHGLVVLAEIVLIANFFNLTAVYFRNRTAPPLIHLAVSAMPLTITFFMVLWNGAVTAHCHSLACRIVANVAVWGIAAFAGFFLLAFGDYYVGFATAFLAAGLGVEQFFSKAIALQWQFAFAVMAIVFIASLATAIPGIPGISSGSEATGRGLGERAPLLHGDA